MPLYDVPVEVNVPETIVEATLVPGDKSLSIERSEDTVRVVVPKLQCHQAVVFAY